MPIHFRTFLIIVLCTCLALGATAGPSEKGAMVSKVQEYMNGLKHIQADFKQYNNNKFSSGRIVINYPKGITIEYKDPKHVLVTYNAKEPNSVKYYDYAMKQERTVRTSVPMLKLFMEDNFASVVNIKDVDIQNEYVTLDMEYKSENFTVTFKKNPFQMKSVSTATSVQGRKVNVFLEFFNLKHHK